MKKNNYFAVHQNKKPKRRLQNTNWKSFYDVISKANELVKNFVELHKSISNLKKLNTPIPKYKKSDSISELTIVGNQDMPEMIVDRDGNIKKIFNEKSPLKTRQLPKVDNGGISIKEFGEAVTTFRNLYLN
jgi:hypothetical protein